MIQCDMPFMRSAIAVAAATAPTPTCPWSTATTRRRRSQVNQRHAQRLVDDLELAHQAHLPVAGLHEVLHGRAREARFTVAWENSLTVAMLV